MSGVLCAQTGGLPNYLGTVTVTVGTYSSTGVNRYGAEPPDIFPNYGTITPSTWADSGLTINGLFFNIVSVTPPTTYAVVFRATGYAPNAGWTTHTVAGNSYLRTDATYSYDGTQTIWFWPTTSTNPYGTTIGATKAVSWS